MRKKHKHSAGTAAAVKAVHILTDAATGQSAKVTPGDLARVVGAAVAKAALAKLKRGEEPTINTPAGAATLSVGAVKRKVRHVTKRTRGGHRRHYLGPKQREFFAWRRRHRVPQEAIEQRSTLEREYAHAKRVYKDTGEALKHARLPEDKPEGKAAEQE